MRCAVRRRSLGRGHIGKPVKLRLLNRVEQTKAHVVAAVRQPPHASNHQCIGAARLPVSQVDVRGVGDRLRTGVDDAKQPAAGQIGAHDGVDLLCRGAFDGKGRDRDRELLAADAGDLDTQLRTGGERQKDERTAEAAARGA